ncbi:glycosyltransferase family 4 protein [Kineococcus sp. SYSU DK002]|uniref:glycosyltransferase family 4 protein n=1 Tax=Kineococcus sp. SYSU DK002 TaxID=3383123 RepID=UPI003D7C4C18
MASPVGPTPHPDDLPDDAPAVAYLVSEYPTLSHAFIENEVEALRARGVRVHTFSVRPTSEAQHRSARSRREAGTTSVLLDRAHALELLGTGAASLRHPRAVAAGARLAARSGPGNVRGRVWQGFYLAEAAVLLERMRRLGLRHLHVHFANNGADVARLVVAMGRAQDGPDSGWRWTMSMHGPTEFEAVDAFDLPAKVRSADAVACISDFCRGQLMRHTAPEHWPKLGLVRMAVDADRFADRSPERAARPAGPLRVLFVGRLVPEKGPSVLLDAVAALRTGPDPLDVRVRVVGAGPLADDLATRTGQQGTADVVELVGPVGNEDLPELYAWADVFCLPSFAEGVPVVLMEAMATGLPVVTSPIAGIPELVEDGVSGRLVPPGRADRLAEALRAVAAAPAGERARWGRAGRERVRAEFGAELNVQRLREVVRI